MLLYCRTHVGRPLWFSIMSDTIVIPAYQRFINYTLQYNRSDTPPYSNYIVNCTIMDMTYWYSSSASKSSFTIHIHGINETRVSLQIGRILSKHRVFTQKGRWTACNSHRKTTLQTGHGRFGTLGGCHVRGRNSSAGATRIEKVSIGKHDPSSKEDDADVSRAPLRGKDTCGRGCILGGGA